MMDKRNALNILLGAVEVAKSVAVNELFKSTDDKNITFWRNKLERFAEAQEVVLKMLEEAK